MIHLSAFYKFVLDHPKPIICTLLAMTVVFALFIPRVEFDANLERMIPENDPAIRDIKEATAEFGSQDVFLIALRADDVFAAETLRKIHDIAEEVRRIQGVEAVVDPMTVDLIKSSALGIEIEPATRELPQSEAAIDEFRSAITCSPYAGQLVAEDGKAAAIMVTMEHFGNLSSVRTSQIAREIDETAQKYREPEEIFIVGNAYTSYYAENAMRRDMLVLIPLVVLILVAILYWSFRSAAGVMLPLLTVLTSVVWAVGLMAMLHIPLTIVTMVMPVMLVAIGSAYGMHILNKYHEELALGKEKRAALEATMEEMNGPVVMTSLTTGAGFASLVSSFVTPIRQFGLFTAFGVLAAMSFSLLFIPAALVLQPLPSHFAKGKVERKERLVKGLSKLGSFVARHARGVVVVSVMIIIICAAGASNLSLESNMMNYFEKDSPIVRGTDIVEDEFGGSMQISLVFDTGTPDGVKEPAVLNEMIEVQHYLDSLPGVNQASSVADLVRELNQALNMGEEEYYRIPGTRQGVAQELLLFTMQGGSSIDSMVSYSFDKAIVSARIENMSSGKLRETIDDIEEYVRASYPENGELQVRVVGIPNVVLVLADRFRTSQVRSLAISTATVGIIVSILMGSLPAGIISILPLILTVAVNFGVMGYCGIALDAVTTMIASIAVGIGVDYSIHYISRYRREIEGGKDEAQAIVAASSTAGRGIFFNALTLIAGFAILVLSQFRAIDIFGYLIALTMLTSSLASLTVVPAVLKLIAPTAVLRSKTARLAGIQDRL